MRARPPAPAVPQSCPEPRRAAKSLPALLHPPRDSRRLKAHHRAAKPMCYAGDQPLPNTRVRYSGASQSREAP
eukprot:6471755-Pyramimonas_sp.AAC.1